MPLEEDLTACEELLSPLEPAAFPRHQAATRVPAEDEAAVVTEDRGHGGHSDHKFYGHGAWLGGQACRGDQARLARQR